MLKKVRWSNAKRPGHNHEHSGVPFTATIKAPEPHRASSVCEQIRRPLARRRVRVHGQSRFHCYICCRTATRCYQLPATPATTQFSDGLMELIVLKGQGLDVCSLLNCALMAYAYLLYFTYFTYLQYGNSYNVQLCVCGHEILK